MHYCLLFLYISYSEYFQCAQRSAATIKVAADLCCLADKVFKTINLSAKLYSYLHKPEVSYPSVDRRSVDLKPYRYIIAFGQFHIQRSKYIINIRWINIFLTEYLFVAIDFFKKEFYIHTYGVGTPVFHGKPVFTGFFDTQIPVDLKCEIRQT